MGDRGFTRPQRIFQGSGERGVQVSGELPPRFSPLVLQDNVPFSILLAHKFPVSHSLTQLPWSPQEPTSGKMWCLPVTPFVLNGLPGTSNCPVAPESPAFCDKVAPLLACVQPSSPALSSCPASWCHHAASLARGHRGADSGSPGPPGTVVLSQQQGAVLVVP